MDEFKKGDRVRVSYESEVEYDQKGTEYVIVKSSAGVLHSVHRSKISPAPPLPEYKSGDKVKFRDGTVGEVCASRNVTNGFVSVKYERPQAAVHTYITVPTSEITPYTETAPTTPAVTMPPYWIDVEEYADDTCVGRVYDLDANCLYQSEIRPSRYGAVKWCLSWISRNTGVRS